MAWTYAKPYPTAQNVGTEGLSPKIKCWDCVWRRDKDMSLERGRRTGGRERERLPQEEGEWRERQGD